MNAYSIVYNGKPNKLIIQGNAKFSNYLYEYNYTFIY
jgi:hypothetical protein